MKRLLLISLALLTIGVSASSAISRKDSLTATPATVSVSSMPRSLPSARIRTAVSTTSSGVSTASVQTAAAISEVTSNWAGYISDNGTYTAVSGTWSVPKVSANSMAEAADATWIGIGGKSSDDLIQVGTQSIVENGQVVQSAFYEELPSTSVSIPTVSIAAGDTVHADIAKTPSGEWTVSLQDLTTGQSFSQTVAYDSSESSAEWIEEAPSNQRGVIALDDFGTVTFSNASAQENDETITLATGNAQTVGLDNDAGEALATVSVINNGSFSVARTSAGSVDDIAEETRESEVDGYGFEPGGAVHRGYSDYYHQ